MSENIDLTKILKNCPEDTEFWSDNVGKVQFLRINERFDQPILVRRADGAIIYYTKEGWENITFPGNCLLWPSKDCRDWSKFTAPWCKKEKKLVKPKFKVGDKIVNVPMKYWGAPVTQGTILKITEDKYIFSDGSYMSISNQDSWELVSDKKPKFDPKTLQPFDRVLARDYDTCKWKVDFYSHKEEGNRFPYICMGNNLYKQCIPYNDDTKHLVGTNKEAPEYYRYWES